MNHLYKADPGDVFFANLIDGLFSTDLQLINYSVLQETRQNSDVTDRTANYLPDDIIACDDQSHSLGK